MITILTDTLQNWLTYEMALGSTITACDLIREYETPAAVRLTGADYFASIGKLTAEQADRLLHPDEAKAREIMAVCREFNWQILTPDHPCYPIQLLRLPDFPLVLYASGNTALGRRLSMNAIVGTRRAGERALDYAYRLAAFFSENGVATVSGCAMGVDSAAHEGALTAEGSTVSVLGNGFGYNYLPNQVFLRRRIQAHGLLLTETPPFQAPQTYSFQRRNRLIAGLAYSVTVVESGARGGSLITAGYARKQQKRLFIPPMEIVSSPGCSALLQNGAAELQDPADAIYVFHDQSVRYPEIPLSLPLPLPPCLRPETLSLEEWAQLNETTPAEAADVFSHLAKRPPGGQKPPAAPPPLDLFHLVASCAETRTPEEKGSAAAGKEEASLNAEAPAEKPAPRKKPAAQKKRTSAEKPAPAAETKKNEKAENALNDLPPDARRLYEALGDEPVLLDEAADRIGLSGPALLTAVSLLELKNLVQTHPGNLASRL